jgi:putative addiction module component (TIGR02574 family)
MSKAFQEALLQARSLTPQEQLALVAALSKLLSQQQWTEISYEGMLPEKDEQELLKRVEAYEAGKTTTISGSDFREELRKKYGS